MSFKCWHLHLWAVAMQNIYRHDLKQQTCSLLMPKSVIIIRFTFTVCSIKLEICIMPQKLPANFHICSYFASACVNNNSASAMWSICLWQFSLLDRQTAQSSFVSSQEQKLYCGWALSLQWNVLLREANWKHTPTCFHCR